MWSSFVFWSSQILLWYSASLLFSLIFLPLGAFFFAKLWDRGYPFYRVLGLGIAGYMIFFLTSFKIAPFSYPLIIVVLFILVLANVFLHKKWHWSLPTLKTIVLYELFFFSMFIFWSYVKGFEPSIRSLEKYMDFGFIQSILNQKFLPPQDMWFASTKQHFHAINYYYFGHYLAALLIKISHVPPSVGYNLMLTTIFALATTMSFSLGASLFWLLTKTKKLKRTVYVFLAGILALLLTNFAGNLHTIYLFTKGYMPENPAPFWEILAWFNPSTYWYPNATRFIPLTIHEFPLYSYVVSDLHGHVLDIPFVLFILALFLLLIINKDKIRDYPLLLLISLTLAINYMTNSTDLLVYGGLLFFILVIKYDQVRKVLFSWILTLLAALVLTLPFSSHFKPFATTLGLNCAPAFLVKLGRLGPLIFEADKCQTSPLWMLFILWGFFWVNFLAFLRVLFITKKGVNKNNKLIFYFFFIFAYSILLIFFAEFFYFKDIYPAHFRANTMFKLGYQAYIMMSIFSAVIIIYIAKAIKKQFVIFKTIYFILIIPMLVLILAYPFFAVPSYFGKQGFKTLDGSHWIKDTYPESADIINRLNQIKKQKKDFAILEVHGDSYTDFNVVSAQTGLPTIVGWPVHEWLWRGSYDIVQPKAEEVRFVYEATPKQLKKVKQILSKYNIQYIVVSQFEQQKYPSLNYHKFYKIGKPIYQKNKSFLFEIND